MLRNESQNSLFIKNEDVSSIFEYSPNKMILLVYPKDLLLTVDWQVVKRITEQSPGNTQKFWMCKMPGFDEKEFPFIVVSGLETFNLINVKTAYMQVLIKHTARYFFGQQGCFFTLDDDGCSMYFASEVVDKENKCINNWYRMPFKSDFMSALKKYQRLPKPSVYDYFDEIDTNNKLTADLHQAKKENESLEARNESLNSEVKCISTENASLKH